MKKNPENISLFKILLKKSILKQTVYSNTYNIFQLFKSNIRRLVDDFSASNLTEKNKIPVEFKETGEFQFELKFAGDILIFMMHTNVFEFSRNHEVMKTPYVKEDKDRSYCGVIHIYNFLADSFKYNRINDVGYLIGRVFINKEKRYFIEGKREVGLLYNNFGNAIMDDACIRKIIESSIQYTINFDLLTPPFDNVKEVTVQDIKTALANMRLKTGKRLGFKFQEDHDELKSNEK